MIWHPRHRVVRMLLKLGIYFRFCRHALIKYRIMVEIEYFIELCGLIPQLSATVGPERFSELRAIYKTFSVEDAMEIKSIEAVTNHDVKAVEYFLKRHFDELGLQDQKEFIHFALTSQDVNNVAMPLMLKDALAEVYSPLLRKFLDQLRACAKDWDKYPMLARTHGQPATPTRLGKEMMVFVERIEKQLVALESSLQVPDRAWCTYELALANKWGVPVAIWWEEGLDPVALLASNYPCNL